MEALEPFLRRVLADLTGDPPESFELEEPFRRSAGIDSLVVLQVVAAVEEAFQVQIPDDSFEDLRTLGDLVRIASAVGAGAEPAHPLPVGRRSVGG